MAKNIRHRLYRTSFSKHQFSSLRQIRSSFAGCLVRARFSYRHSQSQLSQLLGVRQATISDWENGKSLPSLYQFLLLENLYGRVYFTSLYDDKKF